MIHTGTKTIETARLLLRPFNLNDCKDMLENWIANPNIQTEYGEPTYISADEVCQLLDQWINCYNNLDFYRWAIVEKQSNTNIGQIAFCKVYTDCRTAEIEYCIGENFWGSGYAGEALSAVIEYTFNNTEFLKIEAFHRAANVKSGKVLEKSMMSVTDNVQRFIRQNILPHGEICYSISKDIYIAK